MSNAKTAYRVALVCGAFPLLTGIAVFLLWTATGWEWLMPAGMLTIYSGFVAVVVGAFALARYFWLSRRRENSPRGKRLASALICAALLVSNFPAAAAIVVAVLADQTRYVVEVRNQSPQPLTDARVFGGGCNIAFETIPPNEKVRRTFWIQHDGQLDFEGFQGETRISEPIEGYVTGNLGGNARIVVRADGRVSVTHVQRDDERRRD